MRMAVTPANVVCITVIHVHDMWWIYICVIRHFLLDDAYMLRRQILIGCSLLSKEY